MIFKAPAPPAPDTGLYETILSFVPKDASVLDVGAGRGSYHGLLALKGARLTLVDAFEPYLKDRAVMVPTAITHCGRAEEILPRLLGPYDVALAIDFIEHLPKPEGLAVITQLQRLAGAVALFTPQGFHPQDEDHKHEGADTWQTHRSGWEAEELDALGFDVLVWEGFHPWAPEKYAEAGLVISSNALWATWRRP